MASRATGKAKYPHNAKRPASAAVRRALSEDNISKLKLALTPRQSQFCEEYVVDFNASAAALRAGYAPKYPERTAMNLMKNEGVRKYIDFLRQSKEAKIVSVSPDYVLGELTRIVSKEGTKDSDVIRAVELIAKHLGMFIDRTEITGRDGGAIQHEEITDAAKTFTSAISRLADRAREERAVSETTH